MVNRLLSTLIKGTLYVCLIFSGVLFGSTPQDYQGNMKSEFNECRRHLQELTNSNLLALDQYDVFVSGLQSACKNGEGIVEADVVRIVKAIEFAAEKHRLQMRKGPMALPYIIHPIGVAHNLMSIGKVRDSDIIIAGLLHD